MLRAGTRESPTHMSLCPTATSIMLVSCVALLGGCAGAGASDAALWGNLLVFALSVGIFMSTLALGR
jgi:hypothetical protein